MTNATRKETARRVHELIARQAAERGEAPGLIDSDGQLLSHAGYHAAIEEMAGRLRERDVAGGDRVLIVAENCAATALAIFAASTLDAIAVPVNARMTGPELDRITAAIKAIFQHLRKIRSTKYGARTTSSHYFICFRLPGFFH